MAQSRVNWLLTLPVFFWLCGVASAESTLRAVNHSQELTQAIREQLITDVQLIDDADVLWLDLRRFYTARRFQPLWFTKDGWNERAQTLLRALRAADRHGLNPEDYNLGFFERHGADEPAGQRVWAELLLTKSLMQYVAHMSVGRLSPRDMGLNWHIVKPAVDTLGWLQKITATEDFKQALESLQPPHAGYRRLQAALSKYLELQATDGWAAIAPGAILRPGVFHEHVSQLRRRLRAEGDLLLGPKESEFQFDDAVKLAVERFQVRHGIDVDGMVGPQTRAALNVPLAERIAQIQYNLERWRWLPRDLGKRYLLVNTAGYELAVYDRGRPLNVLRIIAGKPDRPTPALTGPVQNIVFNPYWHIPRKIALADVVPQQQRNPGFFQSAGIRVFQNGREIPPADIDWARVDAEHFPYSLRQDPGPKNSLGRIKIAFANDFALYLHDTPAQRLFERDSRAFSSGCIRVENVLDLAEYLLQDQEDWTREKIRAVIDSQQTVTVPLATEIPLYLVYWTAWASSDDQVYFRDDVYGWDKSQSLCN